MCVWFVRFVWCDVCDFFDSCDLSVICQLMCDLCISAICALCVIRVCGVTLVSLEGPDRRPRLRTERNSPTEWSRLDLLWMHESDACRVDRDFAGSSRGGSGGEASRAVEGACEGWIGGMWWCGAVLMEVCCDVRDVWCDCCVWCVCCCVLCVMCVLLCVMCVIVLCVLWCDVMCVMWLLRVWCDVMCVMCVLCLLCVMCVCDVWCVMCDVWCVCVIVVCDVMWCVWCVWCVCCVVCDVCDVIVARVMCVMCDVMWMCVNVCDMCGMCDVCVFWVKVNETKLQKKKKKKSEIRQLINSVAPKYWAGSPVRNEWRYGHLQQQTIGWNRWGQFPVRDYCRNVFFFPFFF